MGTPERSFPVKEIDQHAKFLSISEFADVLVMNRRSISRWIRKGKIRWVDRDGKKRIPVSVLSPFDEHETFLTIKQVATLFKVSNKTIIRRIKMGEIPAIKIGATRRIPESVVPSERLLTDVEVARLYSVRVKSVQRWMEKGQIPSIAVGGPQKMVPESAMPKEKLLKLSQAAKELGLTRSQLYKQIRAGDIPIIDTPTGNWRVPESFIKSRS